MARKRIIKPAFFSNEHLAELPLEARLLFIGLWTLADREGRLEDRPKRIKAALFPYDSFDADKCLQYLADSPEKFILRYESGGDGKRYIQIANFTRHQNPHYKEEASIIPAPVGYPQITPPTTEDCGEFNDDSTLNQSCRNLDSTLNQPCVNENAPCPPCNLILDTCNLNETSNEVSARADVFSFPKSKSQKQPEAWNRACETIRKTIGKESFDTWFRPINCRGMPDGVLELEVPTDTFKTVLESYKPLMLKATGAREVDVRHTGTFGRGG